MRRAEGKPERVIVAQPEPASGGEGRWVPVGLAQASDGTTVVVKASYEWDPAAPGETATASTAEEQEPLTGDATEGDFRRPRDETSIRRTDGRPVRGPESKRPAPDSAFDVDPEGDGVRIRLPSHEPAVFAEIPRLGERAVYMDCDELAFDTDMHRATRIWRGSAPRRPRRIVASLEPEGSTEASRRARVARSRIGFAAEPGDPPGSHEPLDEVELERAEMARYENLTDRAEPTLSREEHAALSTELGDDPEQREAVLARRGMDETDWHIEERSRLESAARKARDQGDATAASNHGEALSTGLERSGSERTKRVADDADEIEREMDQTMDAAKTLGDRNATVTDWARAVRRSLSSGSASS